MIYNNNNFIAINKQKVQSGLLSPITEPYNYTDNYKDKYKFNNNKTNHYNISKTWVLVKPILLKKGSNKKNLFWEIY
jgi:hypothetical protein